MNKSFVLTIISDDKPGIVEKIAEVINKYQGNWLGSNLSYLAGKFAGIVEYSVNDNQADELSLQLKILAQRGMTVVIAPVETSLSPVLASHRFSVVGNDRPGIIREISQAFAIQGINVVELSSKCSSAPHVGTPLFEAWGKVSIPAATDVVAFESSLDALCDQLAVDLEFEAL
jgi:glycine cleavage system regulatory protein